MTGPSADGHDALFLILIGPPGTGKGTQAKIIAERLHIAHISTGEMFREAVVKGTPLGLKAKSYMERGELVPDDVTNSMLEERIQRPDAERGALFDGYPRTLEQARAIDGALARQGRRADLVLHITASDEEIVRRLSGRWLCKNCGEIYQERTRPPQRAGVCDVCGGTLYQRDDDRPEVIRQRLEKQRLPAELLDYYLKDGRLVDIDGQPAVDDVTRDLLAVVGRLPAEPSGSRRP